MKAQFLAGITIATTLAGIAATTIPARAATLTYSGQVDLQETDFDQTFDIPKFNPKLGTLDSVTFGLTGTVVGSAQFENKSRKSATVTTNLSAQISLEGGPDNTSLVEVIPLVSHTDKVTKYDGTTDYAGTSGKSYLDQTATASATASYTDPALLSFFTGSKNVELTLSATAESFAVGSGNLVTIFETSAGALATVTYDYTPRPAPEASTTLGIGLLAGLGLLRQRKRA